jgi:hypothetical protein
VDDLRALPGGDLVVEGLADLAAGRRDTASALLVAIAAPRLRRLGLPVPEDLPGQGELRLYDLLHEEAPEGAYGRYNALLRQIASFASALEAEEGAALRARR